MIKEKLGRRISELRKKANMSQEELAEMLDISQKSLSKIETGRNFLKSETIEKILSAFKITSKELFDFEHLGTKNELVQDIQNYLNIIKQDSNALMTLHKIMQALAKK